MAFDPVQPFVLLDDARAGRARLFSGPRQVVRAQREADVVPALQEVRAMGGDRAGFLAFGPGPVPMLWFARFDRIEALDDAATDALLDAGPASIGPAEPLIDRAANDVMLARIAGLIAAGDVYQVNATFKAAVATRGHPLALFRRLRRAQAAPYGALVHTGRDWILSLSPELLFDLKGRALTARPMKGTAPRGATAAADDAAADELAADPKNRAENLMIVDLLRNDLSRVAEPGSVKVPALFEIERYPTVLQMTSTIVATARPEIDAVDVLGALFPCGSITGAPKVRALEVIADVEAGSRGVYTGSIGSIAADGDARINVAIRTLTLRPGGGASIGLGGGIVADSIASEEWGEAIGKAAFLTRRAAKTDVIETMLAVEGAIPELDRHLARMSATARYLGMDFDAGLAARVARGLVTGVAGAARLRLLAARSGNVAGQMSPLSAAPAAPAEVAMVPLPVEPGDWRLRHKTTDRDFYDAARRRAGTFEVVFVRPDGRITEGSFTNVFARRADGILLTPPLADGLLPGILRARLIDEGHAVEAPLTAADLAGGLLIGNSLRGLLRARLRRDAAAP